MRQRHRSHLRVRPRHYHVKMGSHRLSVVLTINETSILLHPNEETVMATTIFTGHKLSLSIQVLDQRGHPMLTPAIYDAEPVWTNSTPATETLSVDAGGQAATGTPVAPGTDLVSVTFAIGGKEFSASLAVEVVDEPQVATSAVIVATVE